LRELIEELKGKRVLSQETTGATIGQLKEADKQVSERLLAEHNKEVVEEREQESANIANQLELDTI
jgi:hypothetical protein